MKKIIALLVILGIALASPVQASDQELSLWERLRKKIELLTPKKKLSTTTAAGGVRGSLADADDVYWKGEAKPVAIDENELAAFGKAIALVEAGNTAAAQAAFAQFVKQYPDSTLRTDAEAALAQLGSAK
ncbi:tetratricopeptide repeat protein [Ferrigenium sp. UT5]|uniref:tetratricopeptide repeat protein n=1 Tax=Ferrigenium sp. UT5 TaxID=3242105 RepID=UPI0035503473